MSYEIRQKPLDLGKEGAKLLPIPDDDDGDVKDNNGSDDVDHNAGDNKWMLWHNSVRDTLSVKLSPLYTTDRTSSICPSVLPALFNLAEMVWLS